MKTKLYAALDGCCCLVENNNYPTELEVGVSCFTIFKVWFDSCCGVPHCPDLNALAVFVDYLEENVEPSEVKTRVLRWYRDRLKGT